MVGGRGCPGRVRGIRVGVGQGAEHPRRVGRGHRDWCWRCCRGRWGGIVNTASCCTFAVRRFNADFSA